MITHILAYKKRNDQEAAMKIKMLPCILLLVYCCICITNSNAEVSSDPYSASMGNARTAYSGGIDAAVFNPAFLGSQLGPWGGLRLVPMSSYTVGAWSDKLSLIPYRDYFRIADDGKWQAIVNEVINQSFRVKGKSPEESSQRISEKIKGGASIYTGVDLSLFGLALGNFAIDVRTESHTQIDLPEAPFLLVFSKDNGLRKGSELSLTNLGAQARVTTDINAAYGREIDLSGITTFFNDHTRNITDFKYASWGAGLTVSLGHGYVNLETTEGALHYNDNNSTLYMDANVKLKTTGAGLQNNWDFEFPYEDGFSFAGWGTGINAGMLMYGEHSAISVTLRRLGPMIWKNVREGEFPIRTRDFSIASMFDEKDFDLFDTTKGAALPDQHDTLKTRGSYCSWMPTRLNIGLGYRFNFMHHSNKTLRCLAQYVNTTFEYEQSLAPWPGRSFVPRIAIAAEDGLLWGILPVRAGFVFGGAEKIASNLGFGIGLPSFRVQAAYRAIGTPFWYPKKGFELSFGMSTEWRRHRDPDRDGINDKTDRAPYSAEDKDGFEDTDGVPDWDNDNDSIADTADSCISVAEDKDGFEDNDGCPDWDNDNDSVPDTLDSCINEPEDIDGFEDSDGCPEWDNDMDGVADSVDKCINVPEDRDSIGDDDGCPELDYDNDSIPDTLDQCPLVPEIYNFVNDSDGCPDTVVDFTEMQKLWIDSISKEINFTKSNELTEKSKVALDSLILVTHLFPQQYYLLYWCDSAIGEQESKIRIEKIVASLASRSIDTSHLVIPQNGFKEHCIKAGYSNEKSLYIKVLESRDEYLSNTRRESGDTR